MSASRQVRLYTIDIQTLEPLHALAFTRLLDVGELARMERLRFEHHRRRFAAAHGFLRRVLRHELGSQPEPISFEFGAHGKPRVRGAALHFSLTHTGWHAMLAVAEDELGLDAEEIRPERIDDELARRVMTDAEFERWSRAPGTPQVETFFRLWSAKESLMKATGLGLALGPRSFAVLVPDSLELLPKVEIGGRNWMLRELEGPPGVAMALATSDESEVRRIDWR